MRSLVWLMAVTAACGSVNKQKPDAAPMPDAAVDAPPDPLNGAKSGSRIKLQWFVFDDGTKQFSRFHDTQLDADCYPRSFFGDTKLYCVPQYQSVYYTDAGCTAKIALVYNAGCPTQQYTYSYAAEANSTNCMYGPTHIYHLGATTTATTYYYKDSTGTCVSNGTVPSYYTVYSIGAEVTTSSLAEITTSTPSAGTLGVVSYQSADGMNFPLYLHDTTGGFDCYPEYNYNDATSAQCVPTATNYGGQFSDISCATAASVVSMGCTSNPYTYVPSKNNCALDPIDVRQTGTAVTPTPANYNYWNTNTQTCTSYPMQAGAMMYGVGSAVTLQSLTRAPDTVPGHRIQGIQMKAGETRMRDYTMFDTTLGTECSLQEQDDGTYRCMPEQGYVQSNYYYTDAACTQIGRLAQSYKGSFSTCASPAAPKYAYENVQVGSCSGYNIYQVGAKYTGSVYYLSGTCQVYPYAGQYDWFMLGPQVPTVGLASATLQNDP